MKKYFSVTILSVACVAAYFMEPTGGLACMCATVLLSFAITYRTLENITVVSYRKKLFDMPHERRVHTVPTPRTGGFAFPPAILMSVIPVMSLHSVLASSYSPDSSYVVLICPLMLLYVTGMIDDMIGVRFHNKLFVQIISAIAVICSGLWIDNFYGLMNIHALPPWAGMPVTVIFIVAIINAMNMIDGIDGLAAVLSMVATAIFGVRYFITGDYLSAAIAFSTTGALVPFLYVNMQGLGPGKRKLFMGDTGSQTLGFIIGVLAVGQIMDASSIPAKQNFILALSPLLIPVLDMIHVVISRLVGGKKIWEPDRTHIHHRLMQKGFSPVQTVVVIGCLATFFTVGNVLIAPYINVTLVFALNVAVWCVFNSKLLRKKSKVFDTRDGQSETGFGLPPRENDGINPTKYQ